MPLVEKIKSLMKEKGINNAQLAKGADIPYTTVDGFFKKGMDNVKLPTLKKLANYFNCTLDYLIDDDVQTFESNDGLTKDELAHIKKYRALDERGKEIIDTTLNNEINRIKDEGLSKINKLRNSTLYKLEIPCYEMFEYFVNIRSQFNTILEKRTKEIITNNMEDFKDNYKESNDKLIPKTDSTWMFEAWNQLKKDVAKQKVLPYLFIESVFCGNLNDFDVSIVLLKHPTLGLFTQLIGSAWAVEQLKELMQLEKDYSYDDRSDAVTYTEKHYKIIEELYRKGTSSPIENGVQIVIADDVPYVE